MKSSRRNQKAESWVSNSPLPGIGSGKMQSKAERRSLATKSTRSSRA